MQQNKELEQMAAQLTLTSLYGPHEASTQSGRASI